MRWMTRRAMSARPCRVVSTNREVPAGLVNSKTMSADNDMVRRQLSDAQGEVRTKTRKIETMHEDVLKLRIKVEESRQGLTLVHFSAQRKRFLWDRGCI